MIDFKNELNAQQYEAATAGNGPILVLAAAGTGKTRTLVHRVAFLVEQGIPPERILLLTFTNRAAKEMLDRAQMLVPGIAGIWSGTFHHVCARFLRRYGQLLGYAPNYEILDSDDSEKIVADCIKQLVDDPKNFLKKQVVHSIISPAKNNKRDVFHEASILQSREAGVDPVKISEIANAYEEKKKKLGVMDFDDLLVNALELLKQNDYVRDALQEHFLYILVDEYQDTNLLQADLVNILAAKHRNIMAVGDDFQCIYTWRGAKFENIMEFPNVWNGCKTIKLEKNYRSVPAVLDIANAVMKDVPNQFEKTLRPFRKSVPFLPERWSVYDGRDQADAIYRKIADLIDEGYHYRDIAILYRSHFNSIDIQMTLARRGVPHMVLSGTGMFELQHVKDVLALLKLSIDKTNELAFKRIIMLLPGVGNSAADKCWTKLSGSFDISSKEQRELLFSSLGKKAGIYTAALDKVFSDAKSHLAEGKPQSIVDDFLNAFYIGYLQREFDFDNAERRIEDIHELQAHLSSLKEGLASFLDEVALLTNLDRAKNKDDSDTMTLSTVHQAKGMEWPCVIIPWVNENLFPSNKACQLGDVSEERRLFYVAVTRAKDRLFIFSPRTRTSYDSGIIPCEPSRFLADIPKNLMEMNETYTPPAYKNTFNSYRNSGGWGDWGSSSNKKKRWY